MVNSNKTFNSVCRQCGKEFYAHECYINRGGGKYCSRTCSYKSRAGSGNGNYKEGQVSVKCKYCEKTFRLYPSRPNSGKSKVYCSKECYEKVRGRVEVKCIECKKFFSVIPSRLRVKNKKTLFCSKNCLARYQSHNPITSNGLFRGKTRGGKRKDLNDKYFRSTWEANYARYLDYLLNQGHISHWEYEPDTFDFPVTIGGIKFYTPDFKVLTSCGNFEYHEIKGWMDGKSRIRLTQFVRFYPNKNLILIDRPIYRKLSKIFKNKIPFWEKDT